MKILIFGAGIIGSTYGWQLSKAGNDVTVLVRKGKKRIIDENGINIHCSDYRNGKKHIEHVVFRPKVIEELSPENDFEYIIVCTNCIFIKDVLPILADSAGQSNIVFFQNIWDDFDEIAVYLSHDRYFFGFPFMVGGGRDESGIHCAISGMKKSYTLLGELDGKITPRVKKIAEAFIDSDLKPFVSSNIKDWLITHYALAAALSAGIIKAGGGMVYAKNSKIIRETLKAIREGFAICSGRGINPKSEKANRPYYLPLFILVPILKKIYSNEGLCMMFDGHIKHSSDEIKKMLYDIIRCGEHQNIKMPYLKNLQRDMDKSIEYFFYDLNID